MAERRQKQQSRRWLHTWPFTWGQLRPHCIFSSLSSTEKTNTLIDATGGCCREQVKAAVSTDLAQVGGSCWLSPHHFCPLSCRKGVGGSGLSPAAGGRGLRKRQHWQAVNSFSRQLWVWKIWKDLQADLLVG